MNIRAEAKRRKSQTSEARVRAPSWSTPRYAASLATHAAVLLVVATFAFRHKLNDGRSPV